MSSDPSADRTGLTVVIPTKDRRAQLEVALSAVLADDAVTEVVVVDDGSTDTTADLLRELRSMDPRVRPVAGPQRGVGWARQVGAEAPTGDVLLMMDDDVVARPGLAGAHLRAHQHRPGMVLIGYMPVASALVTGPDSVVARIYQGDYEAQITEYEADPDSVLRSLWGGNVSMARADALRVGLRQTTALYHEDRELGLRCLEHGLIGAFDRTLAADHWPVRPLRRFLEIARTSGRDRHALYAAFPDHLEPVELHQVGAELPMPASLVLSVARSGVLTAATLRLLEVVVPALRPWRRGQTAAAVLARSIATRRGIIEARRDEPSSG